MIQNKIAFVMFLIAIISLTSLLLIYKDQLYQTTRSEKEEGISHHTAEEYVEMYMNLPKDQKEFYSKIGNEFYKDSEVIEIKESVDLTLKKNNQSFANQGIMKLSLAKIQDFVTDNPDVLTDKEVDIVISYIIGRSYQMNDTEVDALALPIIDRILNFNDGS